MTAPRKRSTGPDRKRAAADETIGRLVGRSARRAGAGGGVCPDEEVLAAYVDGGLAPAEVEALETHLASCSSCREVLAVLSPLEPDAALVPPSLALGRPRRAWLDPKWMSLAAALVLGVSVWFMWPRGVSETPASTLALRHGVAQEAPATGSAVPPPASPSAGEHEPDRRARAKASEPAPAGSSALRQRSLAAPMTQSDAAQRDAAALPARPRPREPSQARDTLASQQIAGQLAEALPSSQTPSGPAQSQAPSRRVSTQPPAPAMAEARLQAARAEEQKAARADAAGSAAAPAAAPAEAAVLRDRAARPTETVVTAGGESEAARSSDVAFMEPEKRLWWRIAGGTRVESSSDGGVTWRPSYQVKSGRLFSGSAPQIGVTWLAGARGLVLRRVVPGEWLVVSPPAADDVVAIAAVSATSARVTTRSGQTYDTSDGGATWTAR